jgi:integrase
MARTKGSTHRLSYQSWPAEDVRLWEDCFERKDRFSARPRRSLAIPTKNWMKPDSASFLGFVANHYPERLELAPGARPNEKVVAEFVDFLWQTCRQTTIVSTLRNLRSVYTTIAPDRDWDWLRTIANRCARGARSRPLKTATSEALYALGLELMEKAEAEVAEIGMVTEHHAITYRDGLMIALLAAHPILRRRALANLQIGQQLVRSGGTWVLDIPAEDTKAGRAIEQPLVVRSLAPFVDRYLEQFRSRFYGAEGHTGLWASREWCPMLGTTISQIVARRTNAKFGFSVSPHRFRHAAATFWSERDPENILATKDLLGHSSFRTTDKYYIAAQSRLAGRALEQALSGAKSPRVRHYG